MIGRLWARLRQHMLGDTGGPLGQRGENLAATHLRSRGYRIVARNLRVGRDEVDILALTPDGECLALVEVKTRRDDEIIPEAQVSRTKQHHLSRIAAHLQKQRRYATKRIRFDVIAIVWPDDDKDPIIRHHEAAFESTM